MDLLLNTLTQSITFLPLALGISISYTLLRATDMTLDGSFVLGAAVFARLVTLGYSPLLAGLCALLAGSMAGLLVGMIQRGGFVDPLLAGILAAFILTSVNLALMGQPNINLLNSSTLFSSAFKESDLQGWLIVSIYSGIFCLMSLFIIHSHFGLHLRALGDNVLLLKQLGKSVEYYRLTGFVLTNTLAAASGMLTAQVVAYADTNMGFGMTLTGIGALILGRQLIYFITKKSYTRTVEEFSACFLGVVIYFFSINALLRLNINPVYLKMALGFLLIFFLRTTLHSTTIKATL